jgi:thiol-disulfide isomerase/thioredoxin
MSWRVPVGLAVLVALAGCRTKDASAGSDPVGSTASASTAPAPAHLELTHAPDGPVDKVVVGALSAARATGRQIIVYVGASWCEPCQRFHQAAARGELDATFPRLTLLEFDSEADRDRLSAAGYSSTYIPLFVLPDGDGRSSGQQIEGGIKGEGAVANLVPRLRELLSR